MSNNKTKETVLQFISDNEPVSLKEIEREFGVELSTTHIVGELLEEYKIMCDFSLEVKYSTT